VARFLITGGYLVLKRPLRGLVISVSSRFYTLIDALDEVEEKEGVHIKVISPQFLQSFSYHLYLSPS
jgi:phosphomevalonate kinase